MELNEDPFWNAVRRSAHRDERLVAEELAEAERLLAEYEAEEADRLTDERIDAIVKAATADRDREERDDGPPSQSVDGAPPGAPAHVPRWGRLRHALLAAAAVLLAPKFLTAATVATVVVVATSVYLRYTTDTMPFQEAVRLMMDLEASEADRGTGQRRVYGDVKGAIVAIGKVPDVAADLDTEASGVLDGLRHLLVTGGVFVPAQFSHPIEDLGVRVVQSGLDRRERLAVLQMLADQAAYGVLALRSIADSAAPPVLRRDNAIWLQKLAHQLGQ